MPLTQKLHRNVSKIGNLEENSLFTTPRKLICEITQDLDEGVIEHGVDPAATAPAICRGSENVPSNLPLYKWMSQF